MAKVALPAYDQPLWQDTGSWFEVPTIREVSYIVFEFIEGNATGQKPLLEVKIDDKGSKT